MRPTRRRRSIIAGALVAVVLAVRISLPYAAEHAVRIAAERIGFAASVMNIDLGVFAGRVTVEGLRLAPLGAAPGSPDLFSLGRASADLEWLRLLRGELALGELTLEKPVLSLVRGSDGYIELPALPPGESEPAPAPGAPPKEPLPIALDSLAIRDTELHLIDGAGGPNLVDFSLAALAFSDLRVAGAKVGLGGIRISKPLLRVRRELRDTRPGARGARPAPASASGAPAAAAPPDVRIDHLEIDRAEFTVLTDGQPVDVALRLETTGLSLAPDTAFPLDLGIEGGGGSLTFAGKLGLNPLVWDGQLRWRGLATPMFVRVAMPELIPWLRSCITSGDLAMKLAPGGLHASGRIGVDELVLEDPEQQQLALGWKSLAVELRGADVPLAGGAEPIVVSIAKISLDAPRVRYVLPNTALERIASATGAGANGDVAAAEPPVETARAEAGAPPRLAIDAIEVRSGGAEFVDNSGPDRYAGRLSELNIDLAGVALPERSVQSLHVRGIAPERAPFDLRGALPGAAGSLALEINKLPLAQFTPYTARAARLRIAKGDLSLHAKARLSDRGAAGAVDSKLVLHQLAISGGPDAITIAGMPFDVALALLRDSSGDIALPIPVEYGGRGASADSGAVLLGALRAAITGAVTAPIKLLGALLPEGNAGQVSFAPLIFAPGTAVPPESAGTQLGPLALLLAERPTLGLALRGHAGPGDRLALAEQILIARVVAGKDLPSRDDAGFFARRRVQSALAERGRGEPGALEPDDDKLLARYLEATAVPPERYADLARRRAEAVRDLLAPSHARERIAIETVADASPDVVIELRAAPPAQ